MLEKIKKLFKKETEEQATDTSTEDRVAAMFETLGGDVITFCFGEDFIPMKDLILDTIQEFRENLKDKNGFIMPWVHILSTEELQENEILVKVREKEVLRAFAVPNEKSAKKEIKDALNFVYENYLDEIFTCEITEKYINTVQSTLLGTIWNVTAIYTVTEIRAILVKLLENDKSIKNIVYVIEKFAECSLRSGFYEHYNTSKIARELTSML